jgi:hypothetical protein
MEAEWLPIVWPVKSHSELTEQIFPTNLLILEGQDIGTILGRDG